MCNNFLQSISKKITILWCSVILLSGCVTTPAPHIIMPFDKNKYYEIQFRTCVNRSEYSGSHDIVKEATDALQKKIIDNNLFKIADRADLIMTCDIEKFSEGSAIARWFMPGLGVTRADISVIIWERASGNILTVFKSQTEVSSGGLYTIGADYYVIDVAVNSIVKQLQEWIGN